MYSGVYAIVHRESGRWYVGQSQNIRKRWNEHRRILQQGTHHNDPLQAAWTKYGEDAFDFVVLILAPVHLLNDLEQAYLDDPETSYFNVARCAEAPARGMLGSKRSLETRAKISAALKGKPRSDEHCRRISSSKKGKPLPSGRKCSNATRAKIGAANRGKRHTAEARAKMSASHRGRKHTPETRVKIGVAQKGRVLSDEHKAKISAARRQRIR